MLLRHFTWTSQIWVSSFLKITLDQLCEAAIRDTIERFEATGSPVITDGEQRKYQNF